MIRARTFRKIVLITLAVIVGAVVASSFFGERRNVRVAGKPVGFWLDEMSAGGSRSNAAVAMLLKQGRAAVPALTNELRYVPATRTNLIALKAKLPWVVASRLPRAPQINYLRRYSAIYALEKIGPDAKEALPALIQTVTVGDEAELMMPGRNGGLLLGRSWSHHLRAAAIEAAAKIDCDNAEVLVTAAELVGVGEHARGPSATTLMVARDAALRVLEQAKNPSFETITNVLRALRAHDREAYWPVLSSFESPAVTMRRGALRGSLTQENAVFALKSSDARIREAAAFELSDPIREGRFTPPDLSEQTVDSLRVALEDSEERVRLLAAESLVTMRCADDATTAALAELLKSAESLTRLRAVDALRRARALTKVAAARDDRIGMVRALARAETD